MRWLQRLNRVYLRLLNFTLDRRYLCVSTVIALAAGCIAFAYVFMPFVLFPARDVEEFGVTIKMPVGTKLEETSRVVAQLERAALEMPEEDVYAVIGRIGTGQLADYDFRTGSHIGQVVLDLTDRFDRQRSGLEIVNEYREAIAEIPGPAEVNFLEWREGPPVEPAVEIHLRGDEFEVLRIIADDIKAYITGIEGTRDITDDFEPGKREARIIVDERRPISWAWTGDHRLHHQVCGRRRHRFLHP